MITKDTLIAKVLTSNVYNVMTLKSFGLDCLGCSQAHEETLEEGAKIHNIDLEKLLEALNATS